MIDEVDSVLIDDARTPLIISGPVTGNADDKDYEELKPNIEALVDAQRKIAHKYLTEAKKLFNEGYIGVEEGEAVGVVLEVDEGRVAGAEAERNFERTRNPNLTLDDMAELRRQGMQVDDDNESLQRRTSQMQLPPQQNQRVLNGRKMVWYVQGEQLTYKIRLQS